MLFTLGLPDVLQKRCPVQLPSSLHLRAIWQTREYPVHLYPFELIRCIIEARRPSKHKYTGQELPIHKYSSITDPRRPTWTWQGHWGYKDGTELCGTAQHNAFPSLQEGLNDGFHIQLLQVRVGLATTDEHDRSSRYIHHGKRCSNLQVSDACIRTHTNGICP